MNDIEYIAGDPHWNSAKNAVKADISTHKRFQTENLSFDCPMVQDPMNTANAVDSVGIDLISKWAPYLDKLSISMSRAEKYDIARKLEDIKKNLEASSQADENIGSKLDECINAYNQPKHGKEYVQSPPHYHSRCTEAEMKAIIERINRRGYIEAIDVIDAFKMNFNVGTSFRYEARLGEKDDEITEIDKAIWYLQHEKEMRLANRSKTVK